MQLVSLKNKINFLFVFFLLGLFFWVSPALSQVTLPKQLKGVAHVVWQKGKKTFSFDQAILIATEDASGRKFFPYQAIMEAYNDFGGTLFEIGFTEDNIFFYQTSRIYELDPKKLKRILQLPIPRDQFLSHLLYQELDFNLFSLKKDSNKRLTAATKKARKKKERYTVFYSQFKKVGGHFFPHYIEFKSRKTKLIIQFKNLNLRF